MAIIGLQEKVYEQPWQGKQPLTQIMDKLSENPFGPFQTISADGVGGWQPYDPSKAQKLLKSEGLATFKLEEPLRASATISTNTALNSVIITTANKNLAVIGNERLFEYVRELARTLPKFSRGEIEVQNETNEFYEEHGLAWLPECFGDFVQWYHLISPQAYEPYLSRAEMLAIPAYQVQEIGAEGWIELVMYEEPHSVPTPKNIECIVELTNYINDRRHDWTATARPQKAGVR